MDPMPRMNPAKIFEYEAKPRLLALATNWVATYHKLKTDLR